MGWLEDLAERRGHKSLRAVALAMHKSEYWPRSDKRSPRTVENKLHHLDEGKDTSWWLRTGRPFVRALAEVLEEDEDELLIHIQSARPPSNDQRSILWPFKMFPELRPIDFDREKPFPGVPASLLRDGGPRELRTWWVAPIGAGKTLVGRWLEARFGWVFLQVKTWADVKLPSQGRVFVELSSVTGICIHVLQKIPATLTICIACPNLPVKMQANSQTNGRNPDWLFAPNFTHEPPPESELPPEFTTLHTLPVTNWGDDLLQWVANRVHPGGGFNRDQAHDLLFHQNLNAVFATPGDLIGFLGIVEKVGLAQDEANPSASPVLMRWIGYWLKALSDRFEHEHHSKEIRDFRGKCGAELLCDIEMERLRHGLGPMLSDAQWCEIIPRERSPESNRERCTELKEIGVLVEGDAGRWSFKPVWLANAICVVAIETLYNDAPDGLGSLLLYRNTSENALNRLIQEVCAQNFRAVEACLKAGEPSSPEQMVALDGVFRAIGIALLNDVSVPIEWVHEVWVRQMRHTVKRYTNWSPIPILHIAEAQDQGAAATRVWFLAAFSLSRTLVKNGVEISCFALNPWNGLPTDAGENERCLEALTSIGMVGRINDENAEPGFLERSVYRLGAALFENFGALCRYGQVLNLQGPAALVAAAIGNEDDAAGFLHLPFGLGALEEACKRRAVDLDEVLRWCWNKWGASDRISQSPPIGWLGRHGSRGNYKAAERLWKVAPVNALPDSFLKQLEDFPEIFDWLTEAIWSRALDVWSRGEGRHHGAKLFEVLPEKLALQAVRDGRVDPWSHEIRRILWRRMPRALLDLIDELALLPPNPHPKIPNGAGPAVWLLNAAPHEHCAPLIARARMWLSNPAMYPAVEARVLPWLARVIAERASGWREAYALLIEANRGQGVAP